MQTQPSSLPAAPHPFRASWPVAVLLLAGLCPPAAADVNPIPLTPESFTHDVVVERTAPRPLMPATTASMENGTNNTGLSFYERGYSLTDPATGLPAPGVTFDSELAMDHQFRLAPSYQANNALLIDRTAPSGTLTLAVPTACARLSFLCAAGNGNGTLTCLIHYLDGSNQPATLPCQNWLDAPYHAWTTYGSVDVMAFTFGYVNEQRPGLYSRDIDLTNRFSPVTAIDFSYVGGDAHNAVFGISQAPALGDSFSPLIVAGFNHDLIVEASASRRGYLPGFNTATLDHGANNNGWTLFEQGYYSPAPSSGLPPAGSTFSAACAPDHHFLLPPGYASNNAVLVDDFQSSAALTPINPLACSSVSLLCASSHGPTTNLCVVAHADGTFETNSFVAPDWLGPEPGALLIDGRLNTDNRVIDRIGSGSPRLFAVDLVVANPQSPVTNFLVSFGGGQADSHTFILGLSGAGGLPGPGRPVLTISPMPGGQVRIETTVPGRLQSTSALAGTATVWREEGSIGSSIILSVADEPTRFYRVSAE